MRVEQFGDASAAIAIVAQDAKDGKPSEFISFGLLLIILLLVTFRSIVVPIKAIVLDLLSVGAAYGVLVLVFQDGHGEKLPDFQSVGGIAPWIATGTSPSA